MKFIFCTIFFLLFYNIYIYAQTNITDITRSLFDALGMDEANGGTSYLPILNTPSGGLREGFGNAYTAIAEDTSFFEANPASSAFLKNNQLAISYTNLIADVSMETVTWAMRFTKLGMGIRGQLLHVPFTSFDLSGNQRGSQQYVEFNIAANIAYQFFSNYKFPGLSFGLTAKLAGQIIPSSLYNGIAVTNQQGILMPLIDAGILTQFTLLRFYPSDIPNVAIGLSLLNLGVPYNNISPPTKLALGFSYKPLPFLMVVNDYFLSINIANATSNSLSFALALQFIPLSFLKFHLGFLYNKNNSRFTIGTTFTLGVFTITANYNIDATTQFNKLDRFSLLFTFNLGDNKFEQKDTPNVRKLYEQVLTYLSNGQNTDAILLSKKILQIDPSFSPAKEALQILSKSYTIEKQIEEIRTNTKLNEGF